MEIELAFTKDDTHFVQDVCDRMAVVYPLSDCKIIGDVIHIGLEGAYDPAVVRQTALDQIIRSRHDAKTAGLRTLLYSRLLS